MLVSINDNLLYLFEYLDVNYSLDILFIISVSYSDGSCQPTFSRISTFKINIYIYMYCVLIYIQKY